MERKFTKNILRSTAVLGLCVAVSGFSADKTDAKSYAKVILNKA